jgi:enoyl-CoA hydratase/carnithine racemase
MAGTAILRNLVRDDVLRELTYTGRVFTGEEALQLGLATKLSLTPRDDAFALAREITLKSPDAIKAAKRLMNALPQLSDAEALMAESREQDSIIGKPNQVEAIMSQMQKRAPNYS